MRRFLLTALLLAAPLFAGLYSADPVVLVAKAKPAELDFRNNGLLAHVCDTGFNVGVAIEIKRLGDGERFRIVLDPRLDPPKPGTAPNRVVLQQLGPGSYTATKLLLGDKDPKAFKSDTFAVKAGQILSIGRIRIAPETNFLGYLTRIGIETVFERIEPQIRACGVPGVDSLPIAGRKLKWSVEAE